MDPPTTLVVDANILFSFFQADSGRRQMIERLRRTGCRLLSPDYVLEELTAESGRIQEFAGITDTEFVFLLSLLERTVHTVDRDRYWDARDDAERLSPHEKDIPYFALAIERNAPIWSDETAFKNQDAIPVFSTGDLFDVFE